MRYTASLRRRIQAREARIVVVGQGYVGLSLAVAVAAEGFEVRGVDVDARRIADLAEGEPSVPGVPLAQFRSAFQTGLMSFSVDFEAVEQADVVCLCLPTPAKDGGPDLAAIERACKEVARHLTPGTLVILESTTYAGSTEEVVRPWLETSGLVAGKDFLLAYSPERIDPGNDQYAFRDVPRIVAGTTGEGTALASCFYEHLVDEVVSVSTPRAAELAKLLENTYRHVNIALVNEMAMLCHELGIDVWEVIRAAATKPFGFASFRPGPGVGGHCIPVDPLYLAWQVRRDAGHGFRILEQAQDVNARMPAYVVDRVAQALNDCGKPLRQSRILLLGVAYKPDVGDVRESPALEILRLLLRRGARVTFHDPHVPHVEVDGRGHAGVVLSRRAVAGADCVVLLTPHTAYDVDWICDVAQLVFDARNACAHRAGSSTVVRL